jgi:hypothetical protein
MKMISRILMFAYLLMTAGSIYAQEKETTYPYRNGYSIAVFGSEFGYDVGVGAEIGSPAFSNNRVCFRLKGSINWLEQYRINETHWVRYRSIGTYMVYNFIRVDRCRVFVEGGPFVILPDKRLSKKNSYQGFAASTGLELFVLNSSSLNMCYYFSAGFAYSTATAENLENMPRYANGFVFSNGFRFYL